MRAVGVLKRASLLVLILLSCLPLTSGAAGKDDSRMSKKEVRAAVEKLPQKYKDWLAEVDVLITDEELKAFLALEKDYQRDAFIKNFWEARDKYKGTARNEFYDQWQARVREVRERFGDMRNDERARIFLLNGPPAGAVASTCSTLIWPLEVWYYHGSDRLGDDFFVVFYRKWGAGPYRLWNPVEGIGTLFVDSGGASGHSLGEIAGGCRNGDQLAGAIGWVMSQGMGYSMIQARIESKDKGPGGEWVASFGSYSTDVPPGAPALPAKLDLAYPGRHQTRTVVQGILTVQAGDAGQAKLADHRSYNFLITGEVLQKGQLFDNFRYKFDFPGTEAPETALPLLFQRYLRPGEYDLIVKLEDLNSGKLFRAERSINVPAVEGVALPPPPEDAESAALLAEANAAIANGETTLKLIPPHGDLRTGMLRFDTLSTGSNIASVTFALDDKPVLTKRKPPFSVELDLGSLPRPRKLTATAFDAKGAELVNDEILINATDHRFKVRLIEPRRGQRYENSLLAQVQVDAPEGETVERVELFLNEARMATLYQPPYAQPILLPKNEPLSYVRAVAYLTDGNSTEDLVFVNAPENMEQIDVDFVELYASVLDRRGHPVQGLAQKDFSVVEDGVRQEIARFEKVNDQPIHAAVAIDTSASMEESLDEARLAALRFLQNAIKPKDRAAIITFNDRPNLAVKFTKDTTTLAGGLAGLKAERATALYDTIVFSLFYFNGIKGQRAVLLLSDGKDEGSRFGYEDALEYARRAGVTIYTIGLGDDVEKKKLEKISEETGGRAFFIK
ncbi:MAG TPA: VWA domain-containing protein, partial [Thermoanaerobaculia bacterium]